MKYTWNNSQISTSASAGRVKWQRRLVNAIKADHLYTLESARRCNGLSSIARHLAYARGGWGRGWGWGVRGGGNTAGTWEE